MSLTKYDGNIHPDEWLKDIQNYCNFHLKQSSFVWYFIIPLVDATIKLPTGIDGIEKLRKALKDDISFTIFKNANKRKLQLLQYIPEREGGETLKFISNFRKLCYNAESKKEKINSTNELIKEFEEIVMEESNLIRHNSIVALRHVATGKYLSSIGSLNYTTGSNSQMVFASNLVLDRNGLWTILTNNSHFSNPELASYTNNTTISILHKNSNLYLGFYSYEAKSPSTGHTEVCCTKYKYNWNLRNCKLEDSKEYLRSNDIINLSNNSLLFLRSHEFQFTINNDTFQEVVCHNERLGGNDEWCIELVKQN
ncbi:12693_t:CDS:2 [Funneliformis caledonium]|uniref:12693_t:CDS:1 n=1 Tax=Funneliformis caledonium TaxID=1117310 RepID=A0A9N9FM94_9GLOM|nr:12693_t:CDS:2 [Funneliformis caledonium]